MDDPELSIRGVFPGERTYNQSRNGSSDDGEQRAAARSLNEDTQRPSAPTYHSREPMRPGRTAQNGDAAGAVDEMTVRGQYHPPGLNARRGQSNDDYSGEGIDSVQEMANPPKTASPSSSGKELTYRSAADSQQKGGADVTQSATPGAQWKWIQGVFSFNRKDDVESTPSGPLEDNDSTVLDKENIIGAPMSTVGSASRSLSPSTVLSEKQGHPEEDGIAVQARAARETVAAVVQKMPSASTDGGPLPEMKSVPGVWIKSVWGTRQEVQELDLAIQMALQMEQIDTAKYFARDYTEFPSVAHYYVHIHDSLDMEEVDLLASFAGRMGEDHPLVQAMMEIMEEDGEGDDALMMDPPDAGGMLRETQSKPADMGVYITESGLLTSVPPGGPIPVGKPPRRPSTALREESDAKVPDRKEKETMEGRPMGLVPGMDDLVNEISAMSWLSRKKPWKPGQPIVDTKEDETPLLGTTKEARPKRSTVQAAGQSSIPQTSPSPATAHTTPPAQVKSPSVLPAVQEPQSEGRDVRRPSPHSPAIGTRLPPAKPAAVYGAPEAQVVANEVSTDTHQHYYARAGHEQAKESRGLLDIICCRRPLVDEEY